MSEQAVSKSVHSIPQDVIKEIEGIFGRSRILTVEHPIIEKVDKVEFIRTYQRERSTWEQFKINDVLLVSIDKFKIWTWTTVEDDAKQKKAFGKRVKYVMGKAGVPWELAKIAVSKNPVASHMPEDRANAFALNFIKDVKEALEDYQAFNIARVPFEEHIKMSIYDLGYLTKKQIGIIKEYWLSQKA